jgi:hypothetical protein
MVTRVGIYAWAGPGTIRLLRTKYHDPKIDTESFRTAYDMEYLSRLKNLFGVTDAWVTYSWGFSDQTEQEDYMFLRERLGNFKRLGIHTHAYVQGLNVVTSEFPDADFFCKDPWGRKVVYSKGRSFICPNHPDTIKLLLDRVGHACNEDVDGVFVDNMLFGLPPFSVSSDFLPFFGCSCHYCQEKFASIFGYPLPRETKVGPHIADYLQFRADSLTTLIKRLSSLVHRNHLEFGINLYDPTIRLDTLYYGYKLSAIEPYLDYLLIENHSLPNQQSNNAHLLPLLKHTKKPIFVVSYKDGIGYESQYTQRDIDAVFSESTALGYLPCLKVTEFTTHGVWHMLDLSKLKPPIISQRPSPISSYSHQASPSSSVQRILSTYGSKQIISLLNAAQEHAILSSIVTKTGIHKQQVRAHRVTAF